MPVITLASLTGTGAEDLTGPVVSLGQFGRASFLCVCDVGTSVTSVVVQGRVDSLADWQTLRTFTAAGSVTLAVLPEMRAIITNANGLVRLSAVIEDTVVDGGGGGTGDVTEEELATAISGHASGTGVHAIAAVTGLQAAIDAKATAGSNLLVSPVTFGNATQSAVSVAAEYGGVQRMWVDFTQSSRVMLSVTVGGTLGQAGQVIDFQYATAAAPTTWTNFGVGLALDAGSGTTINTAYKSAWVTTPAGAIAESVLSGGCWVRAFITAPTGTPSSVSLRFLVLHNETLGHDGADGSTWLSGSGVPSDASGANGDRYHRTSNGDVYVKAAGTWGSPYGNIQGAAGVVGSVWFSGSGVPSDATGVNGDRYHRTSNGDVYVKAAGTWGSPYGNIKGADGATGEPVLLSFNLFEVSNNTLTPLYIGENPLGAGVTFTKLHLRVIEGNCTVSLRRNTTGTTMVAFAGSPGSPWAVTASTPVTVTLSANQNIQAYGTIDCTITNAGSGGNGLRGLTISLEGVRT